MNRSIPPDFPRDERLGAVTGAHPKVLVREVHGKFVADRTADEVQAAYDMCVDLVSELRTYCDRKEREHPRLDRLALLRKVRTALKSKRWDLSDAEIDWVMGRLGLPSDAEKFSRVPLQVAPPWIEKALAGETEPIPRIKTRIQVSWEQLCERLAASRHGSKG